MRLFTQKVLSDPDLMEFLVDCRSYQPFLARYFLECKALSTAFSYGQLAKKTGVSKTLVKAIFDGERKLTTKTGPVFAKALGLPPFLEEFFFQLVALEEPRLHSPPQSRQKTLAQLRKFGRLALSELAPPKNADEIFRRPGMPQLYTGLGTFANGATVEELGRKLKLPTETVSSQLASLEAGGLVVREGERYRATHDRVTLAASQANSNFHRFYLDLLARHTEAARLQFDDRAHLFYAGTFNIRQQDLPQLRKELVALLSRFLENSDSEEGDKVCSLVLSLV